MGMGRRLGDAAWFLSPFLVLLAAWAWLMPWFDVNPRLFPQLAPVIAAASEGIADGSLLAHVGASLLRVAVGTVLVPGQRQTLQITAVGARMGHAVNRFALVVACQADPGHASIFESGTAEAAEAARGHFFPSSAN